MPRLTFLATLAIATNVSTAVQIDQNDWWARPRPRGPGDTDPVTIEELYDMICFTYAIRNTSVKFRDWCSAQADDPDSQAAVT